MKKKLFMLISTLLVSTITVFAQLSEISCSDFETIEDQSTWTILNGSEPNQWVFGTATNDGTALYISNSPDSPTPPNEYYSRSYVVDGEVISLHANVWAYKDFKLPDCDEGFILSFDWRCYGEDAQENLDFMRVFIGIPVDIEIGQWQSPSGLTRIKNPLTDNFRFSRSDTWQHFETTLPVDENDSTIYSGHAIRLYFHWRNDNLDEGRLPAAIDNVCIHTPCSYEPPVVDAINDSHAIGQGESLTLYPNPTTGIVTLRLSPEACSQSPEIQIFDIYGQLIQVIPVNGENPQIDLSSCSSGVYMVKLVNNGNVIGMQKVVRN